MSKSDLVALQTRLGYFFKNQNLLLEALSHPSLKQNVNKEGSKNYERLEFLGDSILGFVIADIIFKKMTYATEGSLAKIKSYLVCRATICDVARSLDVGSYMIMTKGEEASGGRSNCGNIENTTEAIIGAIFLDSDITTIYEIISKLWRDILSQDLAIVNVDYKSLLQEYSQAKYSIAPHYQILSKSGNDHSPTFKVSVSVGDVDPECGVGASIKAAEKDAARNLLQKLKVQS